MNAIFEFLGINRLLAFLKPTLLGDDNQTSYKRITMFIILSIYVLGDWHIFYYAENNDVKFNLQILNVVFFLILAGILTIQQLFTLINTTKNGVINKDDVKSIETITKSIDSVSETTTEINKTI